MFESVTFRLPSLIGKKLTTRLSEKKPIKMVEMQLGAPMSSVLNLYAKMTKYVLDVMYLIFKKDDFYHININCS